MNENCNDKNPLTRDGTSQVQRQLKALLPGFVNVDERSLDDLIAFAKKYASEINFFDTTNTANGDWVSFFEKEVDETGRTSPHYALFIAFLRLFQNLQNEVNTTTERHLEFYYKEVLQLQEKPAIPDQVHVIFDLAANTAAKFFPAGTALDGGQDATGVDRIYKTIDDVVINKGQVSELKSVFADLPSRGGDYRIYESPISNSADGLGEPIETDIQSWRTFGYTSSFPNADRKTAEIGFAIASPILRLAEGERTVEFRLVYRGGSSPLSTDGSEKTIFINNLRSSLRIQFSGEKGWIDGRNITIAQGSNINELRVITRVTRGLEPVIDADDEVLGFHFNTKFPVAKLTLKENSDPYLYNSLKRGLLSAINLKVNVVGVKDLVIYNDLSRLDADKEIQVFGSRPKVGSNFFIGSQEVFQKSLTNLKVNLNWSDLPLELANGFTEYYANYDSTGNAFRTNESFKGRFEILENNEWTSLLGINRPNLFDTQFSGSASFIQRSIQESEVSQNNLIRIPFNPIANIFPAVFTTRSLKSNRSFTLINNVNGANERDPDLVVDRFTNQTKSGFIRIQLSGTDFGHREFGPSVSKRVIEWQEEDREIRLLDGTTASSNTSRAIDIPREPYTPLVSDVSLDYSSEETISFDTTPATAAEDFEDRIDQFYHIAPFGAGESAPYHPVLRTVKTVPLFPQFDNAGNLYVGLSGLETPSTISILFQVAEGTNESGVDPETLILSYLSQNTWVDFSPNQITKESTNSLLESGIIRFDLPRSATTDNTILTPGLHWIRIAVKDNARAVSDLVDVRAQAVEAVFEDQGNDPNHLSESLPPESITDLDRVDGGVNGVEQPFNSFGGREEEKQRHFLPE